MREPVSVPTFSKALLAGALTGLAATIANLVFDVIFRAITRYMPAEEFNFFAIILSSMLVLILIGLLFFLCIKYASMKVFTTVMLVIVIGVVLLTGLTRSSINESAFHGNQGLIAGFTIISGILALTLLPYLYRHPKLYI